MRAAIFNGPRSIEVGERPDPVIKEPTAGARIRTVNLAVNSRGSALTADVRWRARMPD